MAEQSTLERIGVRFASVGSSANLLVAAPKANGGPTVAGNLDTDAATAANRTGYYFDQTAAAERLGFMVGGQVGPLFSRNGTVVDLTITGALISTLPTGTAPLTIASATLVPNLYVARALVADSATLNANLTGPITSVGNATSVAAQTGTGSIFVMNTSPTLVTPNLGTPTAGVMTNVTGTAAGLTAGNVTTNANLTGPITSSGNATAVAAQTGTGSVFVMQASPTLTTPVIGAATGTSLSVSGQLTSTIVTGTPPLVVASTTNIPNLNASSLNGATFAAPGAIGGGTPNTVAATAVTVSGVITSTLVTGTAPFTVASTTLVPNLYVARAVLADSATLNANLTGPITSVGNATAVASQTGTGSTFVMNTSPTLVTPVLGVASATSLTVSGQITSTLAIGTAPFVVTSTTLVSNLYVARAALADTATTVTTNANLTGPITSVGNATSVASQTGTGSTFVMNTSPTLVTPILGVAAATSIAISGLLSLSGGLKLTSTTFSNAAVVLTSSYIVAAQVGVMSASHTATLPAASSVPAGTVFFVTDYSGTVSSANTLVITPTGGDLINGGGSLVVGRAYGSAMIISDGISNYTALIADELPTLASGKWLTNNGTSVSWGTIATTDISGLGSMALQSSAAISVTGGTLSGITSLACAVTSTATSGAVTLLSSTVTANPGGASTGIYSNTVAANTSASTAQNLTSATAGLVGLSATITHAGTGVITGADCIQVQGTTSGASGTFTTLRGVHALNAVKGGGTTITTQVGIDVDSMTSGTTNFAIRTGSGQVSLGDATAASSTTTGGLIAAGGVGIAGATYIGGAGTVTTSLPALSITQTWNAAGITFTGIVSNITSTASAAGSLLLDLQVGAGSIFKVDKSGNTTAAASTDVTAQFGYAKIGLASSGTSTSIYIGQTSVFTSANYALLQNSTGDTAINAANNKSVTIRQGGSTRFTVANLVTTSATTFTIAAATVASGTSTAFLLTGAVNTNMTTTVEVPDADFALNRNVQWATGTIATQRAVVIRAPTYAFVGASTITNAATFAITGAPILGTNATFTNSYALWVQGGSSLFAGDVIHAGNIIFNTAGKGIQLQSGTGARAGNVALVGGTATVTNTTVTANTIILITRKTSGGTPGTSITYTLSAGASFTINSDNVLDTSTFSYMLLELN